MTEGKYKYTAAKWIVVIIGILFITFTMITIMSAPPNPTETKKEGYRDQEEELIYLEGYRDGMKDCVSRDKALINEMNEVIKNSKYENDEVK